MKEPRLTSLTPGYRALVFGATGGIGASIVDVLALDANCAAVFAASRKLGTASEKVIPLQFDLTDEPSIAAAVESAAIAGPLDLVFVATGLLHDDQISPEKTLKLVTAEALEHAFRINTVGPALIGKHALPRLRKDTKAVFAALSARVGSISDNRLGGWHSYRASKAALNMIIRNFAIELGRTHPAAVCVALHPGTVDTELSKPFQGNVPTSRLLSPTASAAALLSVLENADPAQTGCLLAWDGQPLDF